METLERASGIVNYEEDKVVDFTQPVDDIDNCKIPLRFPLDASKLMKGEGAPLILDVDDELLEDENRKNRTFFDEIREADEETIAQAVDKLNLNVEDGDNEGDGEFEAKALKMRDLVSDGGVKKRVIKHGLEVEGVVPSGGIVTIHYSLFLEDQDEPYDSTMMRGKCERFKLDDGQLFYGLEIAIKTMKKREKSEFLINPTYAFGDMGCPPRIPPKAQIMAIIELLDFINEGKADSVLSLNPSERAKNYNYDQIEKVASHEHKEGNNLHKDGEYKLAARRFERGCRLLEDAELKNDQEEARQKRLLVKLYLNRAHCYLKTQWPRKACMVLQEALDIDPVNAKALYRMGRAKRDLGNYDQARRFLLKAQSASNDPAIGKELASLDKQLKNEQENQRVLCRRMFNKGGRGDFKDNDMEINTSDENYEEISRQLKFFKKGDDSELVLPAGMERDDLRATRVVAEKIGGLELVQVGNKNRKQWKIVRV